MRIEVYCGLAAAATALLAFAAQAQEVVRYQGVCEASAAVMLDDTHFAVASDETRDLTVYRRGNPAPIPAMSLTAVGDIEAAAVIDRTVLWLTSHSLNRDGEDKPNRKVLLATPITAGPALGPEAGRVTELRQRVISVLGVTDWLLEGALNIEGLAASPEGHLLLGLRAPLQRGRAAIVRIDNPLPPAGPPGLPGTGVAADAAASVTWLDLGGRGIRSIERAGSGDRAYLILAGPFGERDRHAPALFWWDGIGETVTPGPAFTFGTATPEALIAWADGEIQIIGDNEAACSDETDDVASRWFPSLSMRP